MPASLLTPEFSFRYCHWGSPHSSLLVLFHTQITQLHKERPCLGTSSGSHIGGLIKHVQRTWKCGWKSTERVSSDPGEGYRYCYCVSTQPIAVQCSEATAVWISFQTCSASDERSTTITPFFLFFKTSTLSLSVSLGGRTMNGGESCEKAEALDL